MLSTNTIARVVLNLQRASAAAATFDTGLLLVKKAGGDAGLASYASSAEAAAGITGAGLADTTEAYKATQKYFAASPAPSRLLVYYYLSGTTPAEALAAVLETNQDFYGVAVAEDSVTDASLLALETYIAGIRKPAMLFLPLIGTPAAVVAADSLLDKLHAANSRRAVATYAAAQSDAAGVMGTAMGLQLAHSESAFALCYKSVGGVTPSDLTQAQVDAIEALGGNVYVTRGYTHLVLEKGSTPSGARYDEVLYLDMISEELQNAAVSLLADNADKLPQTDDASAQFITVFSSILANYTARGVLATAVWRGSAVGSIRPGDYIENGFTLWANSYDTQSEADRAAHKAVPIQAALILSGSLESVVITVNVRI